MLNLNEQAKGGSFCLGRPITAIGDGAKTGPAFVTTSAFCIDGVTYSKTGAATVAPLTAGTVQPQNSKCLYVMTINASGTIASVQGVPVLTADLVSGAKVLKWPDIPAGVAPWGAVKMTTTTATFTPGTTALDAANCTAAYYDLHAVPTVPLTS